MLPNPFFKLDFEIEQNSFLYYSRVLNLLLGGSFEIQFLEIC